jgi:hypothetical protein
MNSFDKIYRRLVIVASSSTTDIWLGDDKDHLVQKENGILDTRVMEGDYIVEFGLGATAYSIHLTVDVRYTEKDLKRGPSCPRPVPKIDP